MAKIATIVQIRAGLRRWPEGRLVGEGVEILRLLRRRGPRMALDGARRAASGTAGGGGGGGGAGGGGACRGATNEGGARSSACSAGGAAARGGGGGWNQLCRHEAQRTCRPAAPIALSGTA
jgi:hypothetical protein